MAERRTRRRFTAEFKAQAVTRLLEDGKPLAEVATELGLSPGQLSQWRTDRSTTRFPSSKLTPSLVRAARARADTSAPRGPHRTAAKNQCFQSCQSSLSLNLSLTLLTRQRPVASVVQGLPVETSPGSRLLRYSISAMRSPWLSAPPSG
jgi:transposase-like protein